MPVSELDIANALYWILGYHPSDPRVHETSERLNLPHVRDPAELRHALMATPEFERHVAERHRHTPNKPLDLDRPRLVFLHIPKCGGTTLHGMLERHFAPDEVSPERFNSLRRFSGNDLACHSLFSGHFDLESCLALPGRANRIVTLLRDPRERLVSMFYFLQVHRPEHDPDSASMVALARDSSAIAFFTHPSIRTHPSVRNAMTTLLLHPLANVRWEALDGQPPDAAVEREHALAAGSAAFEALRSLTGFGLLEDFPGSVSLLADALDLPLEMTAPQQVTDEMRTRSHLDFAERPELTPDLVQVLDDLTRADRHLYEKALRLFAERLAGLRSRQAVPAAPAGDVGQCRDIGLDAFHPLEGRRDGTRIVASGTAGVVVAGPYMPLRHGRYLLRCHFHGETAFTINVWHNKGRAHRRTVTWSGRSPAVVAFDLPFDVPDLEFVMRVGEDSRFALLAVELCTMAGA